jgi:hypothetical protein
LLVPPRLARKLPTAVLPPEISQQLGQELSAKLEASPRANELLLELTRVFERGRRQRASVEDLRLAAAIVLALGRAAETRE